MWKWNEYMQFSAAISCLTSHASPRIRVCTFCGTRMHSWFLRSEEHTNDQPTQWLADSWVLMTRRFIIRFLYYETTDCTSQWFPWWFERWVETRVPSGFRTGTVGSEAGLHRFRNSDRWSQGHEIPQIERIKIMADKIPYRFPRHLKW